MLRILFIHHATSWGGAPKSMIELIKTLDRQKYEPIVLLIRHSIICHYLEKEGIPYIIAQSCFYKKVYRFFPHSEAAFIRWYRIDRLLFLSLSWILSRYIYASRELKRIEFDLVHLNSSVLTDWLAPSHAVAKTVMHIREPFRKGKADLLHYFFRKQMIKYADYIIAISKDNASRVSILQKTRVIYNYGDFPKGEVSSESYSSKMFLYLGGASRIKGFYTLVNALPYLDKDIKIFFGGNYSLDIKGDGFKYQIAKLLGVVRQRRKAISAVLNNHNCEMIGLVTNTDYYLNKICGVISPFSKPHFSRPVIEGFLYSKPAVASDVSGMNEIVKHLENGLLFQKDNALALAQAINNMASDAKRAELWGMAARRMAEQKFTKKNIEEIEEIYRYLFIE